MNAYGSLNPVLEVTVHGCSNLKNSSYFSKLHPYVWLNYVDLEFRTTTHRGGGMNPSYNQNFYFRLIEDVDQLDIEVYSKNTVTSDSFIGSGRVYLGRVLSTGYDDTAWPIVDKRNKYAGEVRLTLLLLTNRTMQPQTVASAPPVNNESSENGDLHIANYNPPVSSIIENIGLAIFNKALEAIFGVRRSK